MAKQYWLIKSEPSTYSWQQLVTDKKTSWDGVRNYAARLNLLAMKEGDECLFYHSNIGKEIVGIARVTKTAFQDPTSEDERWVSVEVAAVAPFKHAVTLAAMKNTTLLSELELIKISRLSVSKVRKEEFEIIKKMGAK